MILPVHPPAPSLYSRETDLGWCQCATYERNADRLSLVNLQASPCDKTYTQAYTGEVRQLPGIMLDDEEAAAQGCIALANE